MMSSSDRILGGRAASPIADGPSGAGNDPIGARAASTGVVLRGRPHGRRQTDVSYAPIIHRAPVAGHLGTRGPDTGSAAQGLEELLVAAEHRGYADGRAVAELDLRAAIEAAGSLAAQLEALAPREARAVAHEVVALALTISRRILNAHVRVDPSILVGALEPAVTAINGAPEVTVLLHPDAAEPVRTAWESAHGQRYLNKRWVFQADASLPIGGCLLRYAHGHVDAGLETQLDELGQALEAVIPSLLTDEAGEA